MEKHNEKADAVRKHFEEINAELSKIIVGQTQLLQNLFVCLLCGGHALIEGVPGLGKTLIVKSMSKVFNLKYSRIQFTPDLMPADILGTNIVNEDEKGHRYFEFYKGPIFGQIILADEINRATPKTQSALLEAMQEERVTVFGTEYPLAPPFIVIATQNPLEMEGTYPLPEAQIDRFFFKLKVDYPSSEQLSEIIDKTTEDYEPEMHPIIERDSILEMKALVKQVPIIKKAKKYVRFGSSPRGVQSLVQAAKVWALLQGRYNASLEDIREVAKPALRHRLILNLTAEAEGIDADDIIEDIIGGVPIKVRT
jgi:MoxR-like ATPase